MSRIHDLALLIARPKDGRKCCVCHGTGSGGVFRYGDTTPLKCVYCDGRGTHTGPYKAIERMEIVDPAAVELAELVLQESIK